MRKEKCSNKSIELKKCLEILFVVTCATCSVGGVVNVDVTGVQGKQDVVVWLVSEHTEALIGHGDKQSFTIEQKDYKFIPEVTVVPVGTKVDFPNLDKIRHHVYSFSQAKSFEIKLYSGTPTVPIEFDKSGIVILGCNIHDTMVGYVIIVDTPYYGQTSDGTLTLKGVQSGTYQAFAWHPALGANSFDAGTITVDPQVSATPLKISFGAFK